MISLIVYLSPMVCHAHQRTLHKWQILHYEKNSVHVQINPMYVRSIPKQIKNGHIQKKTKFYEITDDHLCKSYFVSTFTFQFTLSLKMSVILSRSLSFILPLKSYICYSPLLWSFHDLHSQHKKYFNAVIS